MATCVWCGKIIKDNAVKCRYCFTEQAPDFNNMEMIITSVSSIEGYEVVEQYGFIYSEIVCPNGLLGTITNGTFFTVTALAEARELALNKLKERARSLKANAIIGLDLDISDLNGRGVLVSANGNAVFCIPLDYQHRYEKIKQIPHTKIEQGIQARMDLLKKQDDIAEENGLNQNDTTILNIIMKCENSTSMGIMRMLPINISPNDFSASIEKMLNLGIIKKDENGIYRVVSK